MKLTIVRRLDSVYLGDKCIEFLLWKASLKMGTKDRIFIFRRLVWLKAGKYIFFSFCVCGFSPLHVPKISKHKMWSRFSNTVLNFVVMLWSDLILTSWQQFLHLNCVCFYSFFMRRQKVFEFQKAKADANDDDSSASDLFMMMLECLLFN